MPLLHLAILHAVVLTPLAAALVRSGDRLLMGSADRVRRRVLAVTAATLPLWGPALLAGAAELLRGRKLAFVWMAGALAIAATAAPVCVLSIAARRPLIRAFLASGLGIVAAAVVAELAPEIRSSRRLQFLFVVVLPVVLTGAGVWLDARAPALRSRPDSNAPAAL